MEGEEEEGELTPRSSVYHIFPHPQTPDTRHSITTLWPLISAITQHFAPTHSTHHWQRSFPQSAGEFQLGLRQLLVHMSRRRGFLA